MTYVPFIPRNWSINLMNSPINWRVVEAETMAIRWIAEYREGKCSSPAVESELRRFSLDAAKAAIELRVPTLGEQQRPNFCPQPSGVKCLYPKCGQIGCPQSQEKPSTLAEGIIGLIAEHLPSRFSDFGPDDWANLAVLIDSHLAVKQLVEERRISDELGRLNDDLSQRVEQLVEGREALLDSLFHMKMCASCAEGSWEDCEEGKKALALLDAATGSNQAKKEDSNEH